MEALVISNVFHLLTSGWVVRNTEPAVAVAISTLLCAAIRALAGETTQAVVIATAIVVPLFADVAWSRLRVHANTLPRVPWDRVPRPINYATSMIIPYAGQWFIAQNPKFSVLVAVSLALSMSVHCMVHRVYLHPEEGPAVQVVNNLLSLALIWWLYPHKAVAYATATLGPYALEYMLRRGAGVYLCEPRKLA